jgi:hypothetical protein
MFSRREVPVSERAKGFLLEAAIVIGGFVPVVLLAGVLLHW